MEEVVDASSGDANMASFKFRIHLLLLLPEVDCPLSTPLSSTTLVSDKADKSMYCMRYNVFI